MYAAVGSWRKGHALIGSIRRKGSAMARYLPNTVLTLADAASLASVQHRFTEAADPETLEARLLNLFAEYAAAEGDWQLALFDLAGAGDGHTFFLHTVWADDDGAGITLSNGGSPSGFERVRFYAFMAAQAQAVAAAVQAVRARLAALFADEPGIGEIEVVQTQLAGAQHGARAMGTVTFYTREAG